MSKMKMGRAKKNLLLVLVGLLISSAGYAQGSNLRIEINTPQTSVKNDEEISVATTILNTSPQEQHFQVWSCSYYDNWMVDSPYLTLTQWPCTKNGIKEIVLKPGEAYENKLSLKIDVPAQEVMVEEVTFKLGFKTVVEASQQKVPEAPIIWSQPVTLKIKE